MKLVFIESVAREGDAVSFIFEPSEPISWRPGQYTHFFMKQDHPDDRGIERWFTISSAPSEGKVVITTRINKERSSTFKQALVALKPGDQIEMDDPKGKFVIEDPSRNYIFIAGGIGITPFHSILKEMDTTKQKLNILLLYANPTNDIVFKNELDEIQARNPSVKIQYVINPQRIDDQLLSEKINQVENPFIYISGPEPMVEALTEEVKKLGVAEDNIKGDYFPGYKAE